MVRVSQVLSPCRRDQGDFNAIKCNNGWFYVDTGVDEWVYWGFPLQVSQRRYIDRIEIHIYGSEPDAGGYIGTMYYHSGTNVSLEVKNAPFGVEGGWTTLVFEKDDQWVGNQPRTYWVALKTKGHRAENLRKKSARK